MTDKDVVDQISGMDLAKLARERIPERVINQAMKEGAFREFIRIYLLMQGLAAVSLEKGTFGHTFVVKGKDGPVELEIDVHLSPKKTAVNQ